MHTRFWQWLLLSLALEGAALRTHGPISWYRPEFSTIGVENKWYRPEFLNIGTKEAEANTQAAGTSGPQPDSIGQAACRPEGSCGGPCQPLSTPARRYNLTENFQGAGLAKGNPKKAVCEVRELEGYVSVEHAPHAAQVLYKCWSWWRMHPQAEPVLVDYSYRFVFRKAETFAVGLWDNLRRLGVKTISKAEFDWWNVADAAVVTPKPHSGWPDAEEQWFIEEEHAHEFRDAVLASLHGAAPQWPLQAAHHRQPQLSKQPRIGLLQRDGARKLLGQEAILAALRERRLGPVDWATLTNKSYNEQVEFMNSHDIIVSPHGWQLTSVPFMPDCGGVLEVFPRYYWIPGFFGTLARNSGIEHMGLYISPEGPAEALIAVTDANVRRETRKVDICAPVDQIVNAVQELVARRERCLAQRSAK